MGSQVLVFRISVALLVVGGHFLIAEACCCCCCSVCGMNAGGMYSGGRMMNGGSNNGMNNGGGMMGGYSNNGMNNGGGMMANNGMNNGGGMMNGNHNPGMNDGYSKDGMNNGDTVWNGQGNITDTNSGPFGNIFGGTSKDGYGILGDTSGNRTAVKKENIPQDSPRGFENAVNKEISKFHGYLERQILPALSDKDVDKGGIIPVQQPENGIINPLADQDGAGDHHNHGGMDDGSDDGFGIVGGANEGDKGIYGNRAGDNHNHGGMDNGSDESFGVVGKGNQGNKGIYGNTEGASPQSARGQGEKFNAEASKLHGYFEKQITPFVSKKRYTEGGFVPFQYPKERNPFINPFENRDTRYGYVN